MYIIQNESFGTTKPTSPKVYPDQVAIYTNIYSRTETTEEGEEITTWYAEKSTYYTNVEWAAYQALAEDRAVTTAYENTIELIEELRPEV